MLVVSDIKRSLGYSTVGQMGYMIMEVGLGAFSLAIYHLIVHGIFKATLFLESGGLIRYARQEPNIPERLSHKLFWEEKQKKKRGNVFSLIAIFTIVPIVVFVIAKLILAEEFFEFNAAIVILAFAWLTGTQLFLSFFKVSKFDSIKVIFGLISTFILVVFSYEYIGVALEHFLYGENALLFYKAATLNVTLIAAMIVLFLIMAAGWFFMYSQHLAEMPHGQSKPNKMKWLFYKFIAKEGYFFELIESSKKGKM
jgi:NADH-quinone oxidoreductase subunit L